MKAFKCSISLKKKVTTYTLAFYFILNHISRLLHYSLNSEVPFPNGSENSFSRDCLTSKKATFFCSFMSILPMHCHNFTRVIVYFLSFFSPFFSIFCNFLHWGKSTECWSGHDSLSIVSLGRQLWTKTKELRDKSHVLKFLLKTE